jgi:hypothetical protein
MSYVENEIKVLNVDVQDLVQKIRGIGAKEVFNDKRIVTHFDYADGRLLKERRNINLPRKANLN